MNRSLKIFLSVVILILIAALSFLFLFPRPSLQKAILGKWQVIGGEDRIEFCKDGMIFYSHDVTTGPPGNAKIFTEKKMGKYAFTDNNHMNVQMNAGDTNNPTMMVKCGIHINGDKMDLNFTIPARQTMAFKRLD